MPTSKKVLFYYLSAFSNTGGIEKFNRCFIKALDDLSQLADVAPTVVSAYDTQADERYVRKEIFTGFGRRRGASLVHIVRQSFRSEIVILGHINLAIAGVIIKLVRPKCRVILVAHGIEVWNKMYLIKKWALDQADLILSVSNYTKNQLVLRNQIDPRKITLFPNTIDPYFSISKHFEKPIYLLERYHLKKDQPVILTLSRLVSSEKYKGYDKVLATMPSILKQFPEAVYILAGRYDINEKQRIQSIIDEYRISNHVILTGFIDDLEISDHYKIADLFIMPSRKEGFGIVFLEALVSGTNVIGGNQDGTVDALKNGSFGRLINPTKIDEISEVILEQLSLPRHNCEEVQKKVLEQYRFETYRNRLKKILHV